MAGNFDTDQWYLQWSGKLPGAEIFSCGLRMKSLALGAGRQPTGPELAQAVTAVKAFHTAVNSQISARALLNSVKLNHLGVDGRYSSPNTNEAVFADLGGAGAANSTPANQIAVVVSTITGVSRGLAHRGRFYAPIPCFPVADDGRFSPNNMLDLKATANTLVTALNAITAEYQVAVMSRKTGGATSRNVTGIEIGLVPDTQRRRRNNLVEDYV